jgi:signal transduction histidine kinase
MVHALAEEGSARTLEYVHQLWTFALDPSVGFETKVDRLLTAESDQFDLPYGFLTRIDVAADTQEIVRAVGSHELLQPGESCALSRSYCRKTIAQADGRLRVHDAVAEGWEGDPAYELFDLGSYVGATVETGGELYGTVCFASSDARDEGITDEELLLVDMFARWAGYELGVRTSQTDLDRRSEQLSELAETVAHDLRSPLSVATGQLALLNSTVQESIEQVDRAHERMERIIDDLLTLSRLDQPVGDPDEVDLRRHVVDAWGMVETGAATLTVDLDGDRIEADPDRLGRLFENLFRNCVEHGGDDVSIRVERLPDGDGFAVEDDGPGIDEADRERVFDPGYSTSTEGTGFGLSIVRKIATAHGWIVTVAEGSDGGARFEVRGVAFG